MNKFISFSGGVESTTMCLLFGANAKAITADTGWEHPEMYARWNKVESQIRDIHPDFEIIRVKNNDESLPESIRRQKFFPGIQSRYCTRLFKIKPIDDFLKDKGDCELMIGLNADESERTGNHGLIKNVKYTYPLLENGITRAACLMLLKRFGLEPAFPPYMARGGCMGCFFKSKKEFVAMQLLAPEQFSEVEAIERDIQDRRENYYSIRKDIPSMRGLREQIENQTLLFGIDEIYDLAYQEMQTSCGVFCHR